VTWSVAPPAAHGTMIVIGLVGFHWACAAIGTANVSATAKDAASDLLRYIDIGVSSLRSVSGAARRSTARW
jgi:hypothetical protein